MSDALDGVRDHYHATGLTERLKTALSALGPENQRLTPQQLGTLDQFHTRGLAATAELAKLAGITADMAVLDVGSGVGGPARFLAATYGCRVTGVDLSEPFVDAARYLTERTGQSTQVAAATREAIESAGFRTLTSQDDTEAAKAWFAQLRASGPPPSPNLGVVMGPDFAQLAANLGRSLLEGRLGILTAVFEA
jgi:SAM-dependent methyltransferase